MDQDDFDEIERNERQISSSATTWTGNPFYSSGTVYSTATVTPVSTEYDDLMRRLNADRVRRQGARRTMPTEIGTNITFHCNIVKPNEFPIELVPSEGLFPRGLQKFAEIPSASAQIELMRNFPEVTEFNPVRSRNGKWRIGPIEIDIGPKGKYSVTLEQSPKAKRLDNTSNLNPFIGSGYDICLGDARRPYEDCFRKKYYSEALRVVITLLGCENDGSGYRRWRECGYVKK